MIRYVVLSLLWFLTLGIAPPVAYGGSPAGNITISGTVEDAASLVLQGTGRPVARAKVSVLQDASIFTHSRIDGSYRLGGIPPDRTINLVIEHPGFEKTVSPDIITSRSATEHYTAYAVQRYLVDLASLVLSTTTGIVGKPRTGITVDRGLGMIAGLVIDARTGERLVGASVEVFGQGPVGEEIQRLAATEKRTFTSPSVGYPLLKGGFFLANVPVGEELTLRPKETGSRFTKPNYVFDPIDVVSVAGGVTFVIIRTTKAPAAEKTPQPPVSISFTDVTKRVGAAFHHHTLLPFFNKYLYALGPGIAVNDYDNDGHLDFYISNGLGFPNALFRNNGDGTFTNVTDRAGVGDLREGGGVAFGDIDNDGCLDLYIANATRNTLYHNNCDGTFTDITERAGVGDTRNARSVSFVDYDNDGYLDIFVSNYDFQYHVDYGRDDNPGQGNVLYHNNGDGTFTDVTAKAGIGKTGLAFAQAFIDYNNDGFQDLVIVHDIGRIVLFRNNGDGTFTDVSAQAGFTETGSWMCVGAGDYNNDGLIDIFVSNVGPTTSLFVPTLPGKITNPLHALYRNNGDGTFTDVAREAGVADAGWGWGCEFGDFDNDGYLDLYMVTNYFFMGVGGMGGPSLYGRLPKGGMGGAASFFFLNNGDGTFREATAAVGIHNPWDARSVAVGDFDGDGFLDIFVGNERGPLVIYKNSGNQNHWLKVKAVGTVSNRNAIGARVKIVAGGKAQFREISGGSSYKAQSSFEVHFGLGPHTVVDSIEVKFPSGRVVTQEGVAADQLVTIVER